MQRKYIQRYMYKIARLRNDERGRMFQATANTTQNETKMTQEQEKNYTNEETDDKNDDTRIHYDEGK